MKLLSLLVACLVAISIRAQISIIPQPASVKQPKIPAKFTITPLTQIVLQGSTLENVAAYLNDYFQQFYGFKLEIVKTVPGDDAIILNYDRLDNPLPGGYEMTVDNKGVYIGGDNEDGVFYGVQTLIQLLPVDNKSQIANLKLQIPYVSIQDHPRFEYRGMHLDCGRHFFPVSFIKRYIDYIALHKMNYFHWHLTEDQGWRIQIKKYPKLTEVGAWRNGTIVGHYPGTGNDGKHYGGYYTQDEIKDVVAYATKRYITVIPEIEMPGHSSAAIAAYPFLSCFPNESTKHPPKCAWSGDSTGKQVQQTWGVFEDVFCAGKDSTFQFLEDVLDEVIQLFPSKYIHVGGDECPKANWKRCPFCQKRIQAQHLKDEHELQSYFIQRIEKYLNSKGKTLIGWDEILEGGLAPKAIVMSWRGEEGGINAAKQKHEVIMTPLYPVYFNLSQSENEDSLTYGEYIPVESVYRYEPVPKELNEQEAKYVLGSQANLWTEYINNPKLAEYMIFPRMTALSEVLWSEKDRRDSADFEKRLLTQFNRYDLWGTSYSKAFFEINSTTIPDKNSTAEENHVVWRLNTKIPGDTIFAQKVVNKIPPESNSLDLKNISGDGSAYKDFTISETGNYVAYIFTRDIGTQRDKRKNRIYQQFYFNKATGKKITLTTEPSRTYQGDGDFTLVNGIQNVKGMGNRKEFLGFSGTDCEAVIDLGSTQQITNVKAHVLEVISNWIWRPKSMQVSISSDGTNFTDMGKTDKFDQNGTNGNGIMTVQQSVSARYVKVKLVNYGTIPENYVGVGNKAWLFVDEIEVN
jgi:hexosaminidase